MANNSKYNLQLDNKNNYHNGIALIVRHSKSYVWQFILISILLLVATVLGNAILPLLLKRAVDQNILQNDIPGLTQTTIIYIILAIIFLVLSYFRIFFTGKLGQRILFNIRAELFEKIQTLPSKFFADNQSGDIIQRLTGNVDALNNFFSEGLIRLLDIVFSMSIIIISMLIQNWILALIALGGGLLMIIFILIQGRVIERPIAASLHEEGAMSANVQETLDGFAAIQANNQQTNWKKGFVYKTKSYFDTIKKVSFISAITKSILTILSIATVASLLLTALHLYKLQIITLGTIVLFLSYEQDLIRNITNIADIWRNVKTGIASAERLSDILELDSDIKNILYPHKDNIVKGNIKFVDVDFSYVHGEMVLSDVNFEVKAGQTVALVGPTGAGKTTFVNLIARLYDVDSGNIYVDGVDIKEWDLQTLRKNIGYLVQDTFLFEDTILNNLRYNNPEVTQEQALEIFDQLGASSFIGSLPHGLETEVHSDGDGLSAGQRQIIALARILLRNPQVLILDEATARIDTKSEKILQNAIENACKNKTTFIIAHRLSTIFHADQIILIKNNTILEKGTHHQLLEQKGLYYEMYSRFVGK